MEHKEQWARVKRDVVAVTVERQRCCRSGARPGAAKLKVFYENNQC